MINILSLCIGFGFVILDLPTILLVSPAMAQVQSKNHDIDINQAKKSETDGGEDAVRLLEHGRDIAISRGELGGIDAGGAKIQISGDSSDYSCSGIPDEAFCRIVGPADIKLTSNDEEESFVIPEQRTALCYAGSEGRFCKQ